MGFSRVPEANPTLLVVEEDAAVRAFLGVALSSYNFDVLLAASGEEALQLYRQGVGGIDLVLMDVNMLGLSGSETLIQLQRIDAQVACCFMSGDTSLELWPDLHSLGARKVFSKPFESIQQLAHTLREIIANPANQ